MLRLPLETLPDVLRRSPYHRLLGLEMVRAAPGEVVIRMPFREDLLAGDDELGQYVHGGAIASLIDTAGDFAVIAAVGARAQAPPGGDPAQGESPGASRSAEII